CRTTGVRLVPPVLEQRRPVISERVSCGAFGSPCVLSLGLGQQPVRLSDLLRQPSGEFFSVMPVDANHRMSIVLVKAGRTQGTVGLMLPFGSAPDIAASRSLVVHLPDEGCELTARN